MGKIIERRGLTWVDTGVISNWVKTMAESYGNVIVFLQGLL